MRRSILIMALMCLAMTSLMVSCSCPSQDGNPVVDNIFARKSVRNFDPEKTISGEDIELLVKAGMAAPSAMNRQPWQFFVFSGKEQMLELAEKLPYAKMLKSASAAIVVLGSPEISSSWFIDCAAVTQNILLAAESMGLGAVWTAGYPYEDRISAITTALGIPQPWIPLSLIPIGYPAGEHLPKDKWDPAKVHYNKW